MSQNLDWTLACNATIPANTDVGGFGTILSFELAAWITCFVNLIPAWTVLRSNILWLDKRAADLRFFPPDPSQQTIKATHQALRGLCDLQILTGLSILIAGFATLSSSTYYHQQLIVNFWWLTLNSFWVARVGLTPANENDGSTEDATTRCATTSVVNSNEEELQHAAASKENTRRKSDQTSVTITIRSDEEAQNVKDGNNHTIGEQVYDEDTLSSTIRVIAILISVISGIVYQSLIHLEQINGWDPQDGQRCYIYNDKSIPDAIWIWIAGLGIYAIILFSTICPFTKRRLPRLTRGTYKINKFLQEECLALWRPISDDVQPSSQALYNRAASVSRDVARRIAASFIFISLAFCWLLQQFGTIWCFGHGWYPLVVTFWGFAVWTTYDILDQKISNIHLVQETEDEWGFGQILSMMLLSATCLQFLGIFNKKKPMVSRQEAPDLKH